MSSIPSRLVWMPIMVSMVQPLKVAPSMFTLGMCTHCTMAPSRLAWYMSALSKMQWERSHPDKLHCRKFAHLKLMWRRSRLERSTPSKCAPWHRSVAEEEVVERTLRNSLLVKWPLKDNSSLCRKKSSNLCYEIISY